MPDPAPVLDASARSSLARRLFSWSGVAPLGVFLIVHLVVNARAIRGEAAFGAAVAAVHRIPLLPLVEALFIFVPLALHGAIGAWLVATRAPSVRPDPYPPAVALAMRVTGVIVLAFLVLHLPELRLRGYGLERQAPEDLSILGADLSSTWHGVPFRGLAYLIGTGAVTFHFAAGLWGIFARTPSGAVLRVRRLAAWAAAVLAGSMWLLFVDVVVLHSTGARLIGSPAPAPRNAEPCPAPTGPTP